MSTAPTTLQSLSRAELEQRLATMEGTGITPLSKAHEALDELAAELLRPLRHDDMRPSEIEAHDEVIAAAGDAAMAAARQALVDRLVTW